MLTKMVIMMSIYYDDPNECMNQKEIIFCNSILVYLIIK